MLNINNHIILRTIILNILKFSPLTIIVPDILSLLKYYRNSRTNHTKVCISSCNFIWVVVTLCVKKIAFASRISETLRGFVIIKKTNKKRVIVSYSLAIVDWEYNLVNAIRFPFLQLRHQHFRHNYFLCNQLSFLRY